MHPVGRNGMHKYNNQDHSMYTAMLTVENILGADHDIWTVNVEEEYHEELADADRSAASAESAAVRRVRRCRELDAPCTGADGCGDSCRAR